MFYISIFKLPREYIYRGSKNNNNRHTGDARETSYLFQRIYIMLQRFNYVLLHDTLPVDLRDLWPSDILILAFFTF